MFLAEVDVVVTATVVVTVAEDGQMTINQEIIHGQTVGVTQARIISHLLQLIGALQHQKLKPKLRHQIMMSGDLQIPKLNLHLQVLIGDLF